MQWRYVQLQCSWVAAATETDAAFFLNRKLQLAMLNGGSVDQAIHLFVLNPHGRVSFLDSKLSKKEEVLPRKASGSILLSKEAE